MSLTNIRRSFQSVKKDITEIKNQISRLSNDLSAHTGKVQKLESDVDDLNKSAGKSKKKR